MRRMLFSEVSDGLSTAEVQQNLLVESLEGRIWRNMQELNSGQFSGNISEPPLKL
jgi:hypothetical protein